MGEMEREEGGEGAKRGMEGWTQWTHDQDGCWLAELIMTLRIKANQ